jgi:VCBS repeat-containing protein
LIRDLFDNIEISDLSLEISEFFDIESENFAQGFSGDILDLSDQEYTSFVLSSQYYEYGNELVDEFEFSSILEILELFGNYDSHNLTNILGVAELDQFLARNYSDYNFNKTHNNYPDAFTSGFFINHEQTVNKAPSLALENRVDLLTENLNTYAGVKLADVRIIDDNLGENSLSLAGVDQGFFELRGSELWLKPGTSLDHELKTNYDITIEVNDPNFGASTKATQNFTLNLIDIDDNPAIISGSYSGAVSEDSANVLDTGSITITDADSINNPEFLDTSLNGTYGNLNLINGVWTYTINNSLPQTTSLANGEIVTDIFNLSASDGSSQNITITITGANDSADITLTASDINATEDTDFSAAGTVSVTDVDNLNSVSASANFGTVAIDGLGNWTYSLNNAATQFLGVGESTNDTIIFTSEDGTQQSQNILITGTNDGPVANLDSSTIDEDNSIIIDVLANDTDADANDTLTITSATLKISGGSMPSANKVFHFAAEDLNALSNGANVNVWDDRADVLGGSNNANAISAPTYDSQAFGGYGGVDFSGGNQGFNIADHSAINRSTYIEKSFAAVFKTGSDVSGNQVIFEQGGGTNGYNIIIVDGILYAGAWEGNSNLSFVNLGAVEVNKEYSVAAVHDGNNNTFTGYLNGVEIDQVFVNGSIPAHSGDVGIGQADQNTKLPSGSNLNGDGGYFKGVIGELASWNDALTPAQIQDITNYFATQLGVPDLGEITINPNNTITFDPSGDFDYLEEGESVNLTIEYKIDDAHGATSTSEVSLTVTGENEVATITINAPDANVTEDVTGTSSEDFTSGAFSVSDVDDLEALTGATADYGEVLVDNLTGIWTYQLDNSNPIIAALNNGKTINDTITFISSDGTQESQNITINGAEPVVFQGETGSVSVDHNSLTVSLNNTYTNAVIFAFLATENGADVSIVRVDNVTGTSFDINIVEAPNHDGTHAFETVNYVVMEAGKWELPNGKFLEVGEFSTDQIAKGDSETTVEFAHDFPSSPTVLTQVQTNSSSTDFLKTRISTDPTSGAGGSVDIYLEKEENNDTDLSSPETVGYMAIESFTGSWGGINFEARTTADSHSHADENITFGQSYESGPIFLGNITDDGGDEASLRGKSSSSTTQNVHVEEDIAANTEITHTNEQVHYIVFDGVTSSLTANSVAPIVLDLDGDGAEFSNISDNSVLFDVDNDGLLERTSWVSADDALLVYDYDNDHDITKTDEISFTGYLEGANTDLEGLNHFDSNEDGVLNAGDEEFEKFKTWQDKDQDGDVDDGELFTLGDMGIIEINLSHDNDSYIDGDVKVFGEGSYKNEDGSSSILADSAFTYEDSNIEGFGLEMEDIGINDILSLYSSNDNQTETVLTNNESFSDQEARAAMSEIYSGDSDLIDLIIHSSDVNIF